MPVSPLPRLILAQHIPTHLPLLPKKTTEIFLGEVEFWPLMSLLLPGDSSGWFMPFAVFQKRKT
jgi:hypothetical protein